MPIDDQMTTMLNRFNGRIKKQLNAKNVEGVCYRSKTVAGTKYDVRIKADG